MTIAELAQRTNIPLRLLRYVLDHGLMPSGKIASRGRGAARIFTDDESFAIACAALMLQAGLRQTVVRDCIALLCRYADKKRNIDDIALYKAYQARQMARLEVGDGVNVRLYGSGAPGRADFDTGWRQIATGAMLSDDYRPLIWIGFDVAALRTKITG